MSGYESDEERHDEQNLSEAIATGNYALLEQVDSQHIYHDTHQELTLLFYPDRRFRDWVWGNSAGISEVAMAFLKESDYMPGFVATNENLLTLLTDMIKHVPMDVIGMLEDLRIR